MPKEYQILDVSFEQDQLVDIVNHGMSSGVGGFIYNTEISNTFDLHEDELMTYLNETCDELYGKSFIQYIVEDGKNTEFDCLLDIKLDAVWMYVECKARDILMEMEHPSVY